MEPEQLQDKVAEKQLDNASNTERRDVQHSLPPKPQFCDPGVGAHDLGTSAPSNDVSKPLGATESSVSSTSSGSGDSLLKRMATLPSQEAIVSSGLPEAQNKSDVVKPKNQESTTQERDTTQRERGSSPHAADEDPVDFFLDESDTKAQLQGGIKNPSRTFSGSNPRWKPIAKSENGVASKERHGEQSLLQRIDPRPRELAQQGSVDEAKDMHIAVSPSHSTISHRANDSQASLDKLNRSLDSREEERPKKADRMSTESSSSSSSIRARQGSHAHENGPSKSFSPPSGPRLLISTTTSISQFSDPEKVAPDTQQNNGPPPGTPTEPRADRLKNQAKNQAAKQKIALINSKPHIPPSKPVHIEAKASTEGQNGKQDEPAPESNAESMLPKHPSRQEILHAVKCLDFCQQVDVVGKDILEKVDKITPAENEGVPVMVEGYPVCPKGCILLETPEERIKAFKWDYISSGVIGCGHIKVWLKVPCLTKGAPEKEAIEIYKCERYHDKRPDRLKQPPPGSSIFVQAIEGPAWTPLFRTTIVPREHVDRLMQYFSRKDKRLLWDSVVPTMEELQEMAESGIQFFESVQIKGDVLYIPSQSWYQIIPLHPDVRMGTWHTYTLDSISKSLDTGLYLYHRVCYPAFPQVRKILYQHLQALSRAIEKKEEKEKKEEAVKLSGAGSSKLKQQTPKMIQDALQLFDKLLVEEYTGADRQQEIRLEEAGPCDFCGGEIFHAAFVCSGTLTGPMSNSLAPKGFCEVRICPSCCSEGRSCLCGNLRPCSLLDYNSMLSMRNAIGDYLMRHHAAECSPDLESLSACDIYENTTYPHTMLSALAIQYNRRFQQHDCTMIKPNMELMCSGGAIGGETHAVSCRQSITCNDCNETICFPHLLASGIHSSEAAFRFNHEWNWHDIHTNWSRKWVQWSTTPTYRPENPEDRRLSLAATLSICKPLKPEKVRLGFYDQVHPSISCAAYEDDPILNNQDVDEDMASNAEMSGIELPILKGLKGKKRKSGTPGIDETETPAKRKKRKVSDMAFNPAKSSKRKGPAKTPKSKAKNATTATSTPSFVEDYDTTVEMGARTSSPGTADAGPSSDNGDPFDDSPIRTTGPTRKSNLDLVFSAYPSDTDEGVPTSISPTTPGLRTAMSERDPEMELVFEERIRQLEREKEQAEERNKELETRLLALETQPETVVTNAVESMAHTNHAQEVALMTSPSPPIVPLSVDTSVDRVAILDGEVSALREKVDDMVLENKELKSRVTELEAVLEKKDLEITTLREHSARAKSVASVLKGASNKRKAMEQEEEEEEEPTHESDRDPLDLFGGRYS